MARKTKEEAERTRQSLLKAGLTVFSRTGYTAATLEGIAREAGVTRGAIYWHFGSKAELYSAMMNEYSQRGAQIVQAAAAEGGGFANVLRRVFVRMLEAVESDPALREAMQVSLFKTERTPDLLPQQQHQIESTRALLKSIAVTMQQGIDSGQVRSDVDPDEMARAFLALQNGAIYLWLNDTESFSLAASAPALAEIYLRGILPSS